MQKDIARAVGCEGLEQQTGLGPHTHIPEMSMVHCFHVIPESNDSWHESAGNRPHTIIAPDVVVTVASKQAYLWHHHSAQNKKGVLALSAT
jgi:hypothetical protein